MGALVGFLFWNYPRGRVFLGDAGAYFIGFMYAELSIQLVARNSDISPWYVIMLAGYPIVDTLFAMYRRGVVRHVPLMAPDALAPAFARVPPDRAADRAPAARPHEPRARQCARRAAAVAPQCVFAWRWPCSSTTIRLRCGWGSSPTRRSTCTSTGSSCCSGGRRARRLGAAPLKGTSRVKRSNVL